MARTFKANDYIAALNNWKTVQQLKSPCFNSETFIIGLKKCDLPYSNNFLKACTEAGILEKVKRNLYQFPSKDPIHTSDLQKAYDIFSSNNRRNYNRRKNSTPNIEVTVLEELPHEDKITEAINLLKREGYKIFKPVVIYSEI